MEQTPEQSLNRLFRLFHGIRSHPGSLPPIRADVGEKLSSLNRLFTLFVFSLFRLFHRVGNALVIGFSYGTEDRTEFRSSVPSVLQRLFLSRLAAVRKVIRILVNSTASTHPGYLVSLRFQVNRLV